MENEKNIRGRKLTDTANYGVTAANLSDTSPKLRSPQWTETYWGLSVRDVTEISGWVICAQVIAFVFCAGCVVAALGLWLAVPGTIFSEQFIMRGIVSAFLLVAAYFMLNYANRGGIRELEFDHNLGEIRAFSINRNGSRLMTGQFGIDSFDSLTIVDEDAETATLVLNRLDGRAGLLVSRGNPSRVRALDLRLDRDMLRSTTTRMHTPVDPITI